MYTAVCALAFLQTSVVAQELPLGFPSGAGPPGGGVLALMDAPAEHRRSVPSTPPPPKIACLDRSWKEMMQPCPSYLHAISLVALVFVCLWIRSCLITGAPSIPRSASSFAGLVGAWLVLLLLLVLTLLLLRLFHVVGGVVSCWCCWCCWCWCCCCCWWWC